MIDLRNGQITDLLNNPMRYHPEAIAIGYAVQQEKQRIMALAEQTRLMSAINSLPERTLDYLAVELRTPVYRQYFSLEVKRKLIAATIPYYAHLGTPAAVDLVINAIFAGGHVQEWFEYQGEPHHFRVFINVTGRVTQLAETEEMRLWVGETKRLSSWLDEIRYVMEAKDPAIFRMGGGVGAIVTLPIPAQDDEYDFRQTVRMGGKLGVAANIPVPQAPDIYDLRAGTLRTGGGVGLEATVPIPQAPDVYELRKAELHTGGGAGVAATVPIPEKPDSFDFQSAVKTGGNAGLAASIPVPERPDEIRFERESRTGGAAGVAASLPIPERPDELKLKSTTHVGGSGTGIAASIPVPEKPDRLEVESKAGTGGTYSVISTTPVAENKEE